MYCLRERGVLVTGASSGIGRELAWCLARRGARLALIARRLERLQALRQEMEEQGLAAPWVGVCDVGQWSQVEALRERLEASFGPVQVLVNNAGRGVWGPFPEVPVVEMEAVIRTNLLGSLYCARVFVPAMLERGEGCLVFVSSVLGTFPALDHAVYGASKFGTSGLAENLSYELEPRGIRVLLVEPGVVPTEFGRVSGVPDARYQSLPSTPAPQMASRIVCALERGKRRVGPDRLAQLGILLRRHFPRATRVLLRWAFERMRGGQGGGLRTGKPV